MTKRRECSIIRCFLERKSKCSINMAAISDYFTHDVSLYPGCGVEFYVFDSSKSIAFVQDCLMPFREAYISEEKLTHIVSRFPTTRKDAISRRLPRKGMVMSGDFGEIL